MFWGDSRSVGPRGQYTYGDGRELMSSVQIGFIFPLTNIGRSSASMSFLLLRLIVLEDGDILF